jgi:hypothetical protein
MVALTITFPQMVMHYKGDAAVVDPATIKIEVPGFGTGGGGLTLPDNGGGLGLPGGLQLPGGSPLDGTGQQPADQNGSGNQQKPANDLSAPPSFN